MKKYNVRNYSDKALNQFLTLTESNLNVSIHDGNSDYSWVDIFDEYMEVLDNIIRNPRRFIQSEESLVPIEKAKKFTEESIKHLAQNTQLIQDIDSDGMPQPLKVLNVYKEETYDLYENRFIHSLVENLFYFLKYQFEKIKEAEDSTSSNGKEINYESKTEIDDVKYETKLNINISNKESTEKIDTKAISKKIENMYTIVVGFQSSTIMKELERAEPVRSPIRKTNAILKDPLLNKCLELWEILEKYQNGIEVEKAKELKTETNEDFINGLDLTNFLNYCIVTNRKEETLKNIIVEPKEAFKQLIKQYIRKKEVTISNFRTTIVKDFDIMCETYVKQYDDVNNIYDNLLDKYNQIINKDYIK